MKEKTKEIILKYLEESSTDVLERFSKNLFEKKQGGANGKRVHRPSVGFKVWHR